MLLQHRGLGVMLGEQWEVVIQVGRSGSATLEVLPRRVAVQVGEARGQAKLRRKLVVPSCQQASGVGIY